MQRRSHGYRVRAVKRSIDLTVALPGLVMVCVLAPWVSLANRLTGDTGPVFFRDTRVGQGGRPFRILKFRTMHAADGPGITFHDDPRITRVGRFLRRTKLDELPQLVNVLRGEMTVVGPRPESPDYVDWSDPIQRAVIDLKPGITGPSQLAYLHEEESLVDDVQYRNVVLPRKLSMDRAYAKRASPRRDLKIILATIRALVQPSFPCRLIATFSPSPAPRLPTSKSRPRSRSSLRVGSRPVLERMNSRRPSLQKLVSDARSP